MPTGFIALPGTEVSAPRDADLQDIDPDEMIDVSLYLRCAAFTAQDDPLASAQNNPCAVMTRQALRERREAELEDTMIGVRNLANEHNLRCSEVDMGRRRVVLSGRAADLQNAFQTRLHAYTAGGTTLRRRSAAIHVPDDLADRIEAVLGFDDAPIATPKFVQHQGPQAPEGYLPTTVASLYDLPKNSAQSQCIGIIELGGGYTDADNQAAFAAMSLAVPEIVAVPVSGGSNAPSDGSGADGEVALDIQVAGGAAPGAKLAVYFAPNTSQGFVDAITQAVHDQENMPSVLSISWGSPEDRWAEQERNAMHAALQDAARVGVTVCAASGDGLATDRLNDGQLHVDFPASDPYTLGCGGTFLQSSGDQITAETVWNSNGGGTGGGVSRFYDQPSYQNGAGVPASGASGGPKRGVPDVAGDADPNSGYRIITGGRTAITGGTSAVAPLWAALVALINATNNASLGFPHARLYNDTASFRDIVEGNNESDGMGYSAGPGWDACTGLGSPMGTALLNALSS